jgi:hypothetical protein
LLGIRSLGMRVRWFLFDKCKCSFPIRINLDQNIGQRADASRWYDWIGAVGGGGMMTVGLIIAIWRIILSKE